MKFLMAGLLIMNVALAAPKEQAKPAKPVPAKSMAKTGDKAKEALKEKEDCDDKAKKSVEIKPESITLGGNTGCSLEDL